MDRLATWPCSQWCPWCSWTGWPCSQWCPWHRWTGWQHGPAASGVLDVDGQAGDVALQPMVHELGQTLSGSVYTHHGMPWWVHQHLVDLGQQIYLIIIYMSEREDRLWRECMCSCVCMCMLTCGCACLYVCACMSVCIHVCVWVCELFLTCRTWGECADVWLWSQWRLKTSLNVCQSSIFYTTDIFVTILTRCDDVLLQLMDKV